jgi:hypothetical protein
MSLVDITTRECHAKTVGRKRDVRVDIADQPLAGAAEHRHAVQMVQAPIPVSDPQVQVVAVG